MRISLKISFVLIFFVILIVAVALVFEFDTPKHNRQETITILRGENVFQIASDLKAEQLIRSKLIFLFYVIKTGNARNLQAGEYDLEGLGYYDIIDRLSRGEAAAKSITIIPGWDTRDVAGYFKLVGATAPVDFASGSFVEPFKAEFDFLADLPEGASIEGYLYPDTYEMPKNPTAEVLARLMLKNFDKKLSPELRQEITRQNKTIFDIITMASMIEKEVRSPEDKKKVSGILWKRLAAKMPLQVDSTLLYYKTSESPGAINKSTDSPYNTYKYSGLPIGPICNPGIESIEAAIYPQESPYWYYLSAADGTTIFSKTYDEHRINIAKYLKLEGN